MILKKVVLQNFLSHTDSVVEFNPNGITAIIGENGSGKSSIIEAVQFALFGDSGKGNLGQLIKWGKKEAVVELEFENQLGVFKIHREIVKSGKSASSQNSAVYKFEKGAFRLFYQKNLKTELPKLTGLTKRTFETSGLIKQGEIEGLLSVKPAEREKIIQELLGIQYYQRLIEKYREIKKTIKDKIETLLERIPDINLIQHSIQEKESQLVKAKKMQEDLLSEISKLKAVIDEINTQLETTKDIKAKIELKESLKNKVVSQLEKLKEELAQIETLKKSLPELTKKYKEYIDLNYQLQKVQEVENLTNHKKILQEKLQNVIDDIQFIQNFRETAVKFEENKAQLQNLKSRLEEINTVLATIDKKLIEKDSLEKQLSQKEEELKFIQSFENTALEYEEKQVQLNQILQNINQLSQKKGQIQQLQETINYIQQELSHKKSKLLKIANLLKESYHQKFQILELNPTMIDEFIKQNELKIEQLLSQKETLQTERAEIQTEGKLYRQKLNNLSSIDTVCPVCSRPIDKNEKDHLVSEISHTLENLKKTYEEKQKQLRELESEIEKQKQIKTHLTEFKNIYSVYKERESEKKKLQETLNIYNHQIGKLQQLEEQKQQIESFLQAHNAEYGRYKSLKEKNIQKDISIIIDTLTTINNFLEKNNLEKLKEEKQSIIREINQIERFISQNEVEYFRYSSLNIDKLLDTQHQLQKQIEQIVSQITESGILTQDLSNLKNQIKQQIEFIQKDYDMYLQTVQKIKEEEKLSVELEEIQQELTSLNTEIAELQNQLSKIDLPSTLAEKERHTKIMEELLQHKETLSLEVVKLQTELETLKASYEETKKELEEIEDLKEKLDRYEKVIDTLSHINRLVKDNALYMLPKITEEIFSRFNFSGFSGLEFDEKYSIILLVAYPGAHIKTTVESLSGGQRIALALALRFAISYMLNTRLEFLILDEPTIHMDRQRRRELIDLIGDLKEKNFVKQLIVVTHDEEIEERADTIYKVDAGQVELV